ncbi:MAG TPA: LysR family transcriptional regulator [Aliidongia sp.]|uniref:LysR family transcriptional regulator n=1 Tax=Aliidongia sp. TaxID=1914230 RepID=UPI002DDC9D89|nr:LysR family transcriptional regulator [Aliidongia sp.]HEV2673857.1 LysR family transcriptional regulator [Aliidongia sp.]
MESLSGIAAFVQAAEQLSYAAAGRLLGLSSSAVAKSVARLEARLGVRLLHRTTRRIGLTEEGALFYERCKRILDDIRDAEATVTSARTAPRGRLRVSVPHAVGHFLVLPHLAAYLARYPEIEMELDFDDRSVDVIEEGLDLVIRTGNLADSRLMARRLGGQHFVACGTPGYFDRHGRPGMPQDLARHRCIHFKFPTSGRLQPWPFSTPLDVARLPKSLVFNNSDAVLWAALEGLGIGLLPVYVAREPLRTGLLQAVLSDDMVERGALWLLWPTHRQLSPKLRVFVDFLTDRLREEIWAFTPSRLEIPK